LEHIIVIGGGIAGLVCANLLAKEKRKITVIEKGHYPRHKVCGEYVSNEVRDFLKKKNLFPDDYPLPSIHKFMLTSAAGMQSQTTLETGGFGISRYYFDDFLHRKALGRGVEVRVNTSVSGVQFNQDTFSINLKSGEALEAKWVIGAFGKRSGLDKKLNRPFIKFRSDYLGVKYHIHTDFPDDAIALHNFEGGYCGISKVENDRYNLCYLGSRQVLRRHNNIAEMEQNVLMRNPYLNTLFRNADFLFDKPVVINEISFRSKLPVEKHIFMVGDSAGLITPLCGNGMAMAIHSAKILAETLEQHIVPGNGSRHEAERAYVKKWRQLFANRLLAGRLLQNIFGGVASSNFAVNLLNKMPPLAKWIIQSTHGKPI